MKTALNKLKSQIVDNIDSYEKTQPIIYNFLNNLYIDIDEKPLTITVAHLLLAEDILTCDNHNWMTNQIYKLYNSLGQDTTGFAGF